MLIFSKNPSITLLLISISLISLIHSISNTAIITIINNKYNSDILTSLFTSLYFLGFILGTRIIERIIINVGQIRSFAAFATIISITSLQHIIFADNVTIWLILRFFYGFACVGCYMTIEAWLNVLISQSNSDKRGAIMGFYTSLNFVMYSMAQYILSYNIEYVVIFTIISIISSLAILLLLLTKAVQPENINSEIFSIKKLYQISPLAVIGSFMSGILCACVWGMMIPNLLNNNITYDNALKIMSFTFIGGVFFQYLFGYISDFFNKRIVILNIIILLSLSIIIILFYLYNEISYNFIFISAILIFGGTLYSLYPISMSLANDFIDSKLFLKISATILLIYSIGSLIGPVLLSLLTMFKIKFAIFYFMIMINILYIIFATYRIILGEKIPETDNSFIITSNMNPIIYDEKLQYQKDVNNITNNS